MSAMLIMLLAADTSAPPASVPLSQATAIMDVTDRPPEMVERNGVRWGERLSVLPGASDCGLPKTKCHTHLVEVTNYSASTLRCHGKIHYPQPNTNGIKDVDRTVIVPRSKAWNVVRVEAPAGMLPTSYEVDCTPEPELAAARHTPQECTLKVIRSARSGRVLHEGIAGRVA